MKITPKLMLEVGFKLIYSDLENRDVYQHPRSFVTIFPYELESLKLCDIVKKIAIASEYIGQETVRKQLRETLGINATHN